MTTNIDRTRDFYELLLTDFNAATEKYVAEDFVWENPLPDIIPFGGIYEGKAGLGQYLQEISEALTMSPLSFTDMIADGPLVAAIGIEENTLVKSTGKHYTMPFVHVLRFTDEGKVKHLREYNDIREMITAFGG